MTTPPNPTDDVARGYEGLSRGTGPAKVTVMSVTTKELSMNTIITLAFEGKEAEEVAELTRAVDLGQLLRDALGEFVAARQPEADYVVTRHGDRTRLFRAKLREVVKRNLLACLLKRADVTIETLETSPSDDAAHPGSSCASRNELSEKA